MIEVRIGMTQTARELSVEIEGDADDVAKQVDQAVASADGTLWLTDTKGKRIGVVVSKLSYVEVLPDASARSVGFSR